MLTEHEQATARRYVAEYDENGCVWLIDLATKTRTPLAHGDLLDVVGLTPACVPAPPGGTSAC